MKSVFICTTVRHILLSSIIILKDKLWGSLMIVCHDHQNLKNTDFNFNELKKLNCVIHFVNEQEMLQGFYNGNCLKKAGFISKNIHLSRRYGFLYAADFICYCLDKVVGINYNKDVCFLFHDRTFISKVSKKFSLVYLVEDGLANYTAKPVDSLLKKIIRAIYCLDPYNYYMGESRDIKAIYAMAPDKLPDSVKHKGKNLKTYINNIDMNENKKLMSIFKYTRDSDSPSVVLLTQALDVAGLCTKEDKIYIYTKIINFMVCKVKNTKKIVIKLHPAENVQDYTVIKETFKNIDILSSKMPVEIFGLADSTVTSFYSLHTSSTLITPSGTMDVINLIEQTSQWLKFDVNAITNDAISKLSDINDENGI